MGQLRSGWIIVLCSCSPVAVRAFRPDEPRRGGHHGHGLQLHLPVSVARQRGRRQSLVVD